MSKLMEKLRKEKERLEKESENRGNFEKVEWWRPEKGDNLIRILPNLEDPDGSLPFKSVKTHFIGIEKKDGTSINIPVRCLQDFGEDCPVCNEYEKTISKDKEKAKQFRARESYIYAIIDYKTKSIHPYQCPVTVHEQIMGFAEDFGGNIFSLEEGRDWKLVKKVDPRKPKMLGVTYALRPSMKDTALPAKMEGLLEGAPDFDKLFEDKERDKMLKWLGYEVAEKEENPSLDTEEEGLDLESEFEEAEETPKAAKKAAAAKAAAKAKAKAEPPEFDEDEEMPEFDEEPAPAAKKAAPKKAAPKKIEPEDDDFGVDVDDDELESELRDLGVM